MYSLTQLYFLTPFLHLSAASSLRRHCVDLMVLRATSAMSVKHSILVCLAAITWQVVPIATSLLPAIKESSGAVWKGRGMLRCQLQELRTPRADLNMPSI
ncbi:hypothetical protein V8C86DRAFT_977370 [Haematococcus lacustris]